MKMDVYDGDHHYMMISIRSNTLLRTIEEELTHIERRCRICDKNATNKVTIFT